MSKRKKRHKSRLVLIRERLKHLKEKSLLVNQDPEDLPEEIDEQTSTDWEGYLGGKKR